MTAPLFVGVMSGTSMDGVDCALVSCTDGGAQLRSAAGTPWPTTLRERLQAFAAGAPLTADACAALDADTGRFMADCVNRLLDAAGIAQGAVRAIGCHGQTVAHDANSRPPITMQLGDPNLIAEHTGITTISDFRRRDIAAGGQGAPLAPAFHAAVLSAAAEHRVVLNLGGIANITVLPGDGGAATGFDTGPANCLLDAHARQHLGQPFDRDGAWAAAGKVNPELLALFLADDYFSLPPPKSTGTQHFSARWLHARLGEARGQRGDARPQPAPADVQASLLALTVTSIADAIRQHAPDTQRVLVCGGGSHNPVLLDGLVGHLGVPVESTAAYGVDPDWMEAMAFAWLASRTLANLPGNLPPVTGARGFRILGAIHPA